MNRSVKTNAFLNVIKTIMLIIFPLVTFPYATRVLGAENIGKVQFGSSIIAYVLLFSSLGLTTYATREGTVYRNDRKKMSEFATQMFSINMLFTLISYILLFIALLLPTKLQDYKCLLLVQSISVIFTTLAVEWIYNIYEDYLFITIRSILTYVIALILLFVFVHDQSDYYWYALINVIATSSSYLLNFIHAKKYCDIRITFKTNLKKHFKSLLTLFSNNLATQIYINADVTMLGLLLNDYYVGIYGVATKVYFTLKNITSAMIIVAIPRLSYYKNNKKENEYNTLCSNTINSCIIVIIPITIGLVLFSRQIVGILAGPDYAESILTLQILASCLIFATIANFFSNAILIINKLEKYALRATIISAVANIGLNFIFIPLLHHNGVAITTLIAEVMVAALSYHYAKGKVKITDFRKNLITSIIGSISIVIIYYIINVINLNRIIILIITPILGAITYFIVLLLLKNKIATENFDNIKNRIFKKKDS